MKEIRIYENGCGYEISGLEPSEFFPEDTTDNTEFETPMACAANIAHMVTLSMIRGDLEEARLYVDAANQLDKLYEWLGMKAIHGAWTKESKFRCTESELVMYFDHYITSGNVVCLERAKYLAQLAKDMMNSDSEN